MQRRTPLLALLLMSALVSSARAQGPSGEFYFSFSRTDVPVWDFTGEYNVTNLIEERLTFVHLANGRITGTADAVYDDDGAQLRLTGRLSGRAFGHVTSGVRLNASGKGRLAGSFSGRPLNGPATLGLALGLDPQLGLLEGTQSARICVFVRCQTLSTDASLILPREMDGHWTLALNVGTTNNNIRGSATATLANGKELPYRVRGRHSLKTSISTLTLRGTGVAAGTVLTLRLDSANHLVALTGRLFGQRLTFP